MADWPTPGSAGVMLVTGGGRGIGAATARLAAERGYAVAVNYVSDERAAETVVEDISRAGGQAIAIQADTADPQEVADLFEAVDRALGPVSALVNNAGITGPASRVDEADPATLRRVVDINVMGVMYCAREAVLRMSTRHGGAGGGIVNVSSGAASLGSPGEFVWYAASKGAVDSFTLGLGKEVAAEGIRVNAVAPGLIETDIHAASGNADRVEKMAPTVPIQRAADPVEVAGPILWLLSEEAKYITGAVLRIAGGR